MHPQNRVVQFVPGVTDAGHMGNSLECLFKMSGYQQTSLYALCGNVIQYLVNVSRRGTC